MIKSALQFYKKVDKVIGDFDESFIKNISVGDTAENLVNNILKALGEINKYGMDNFGILKNYYIEENLSKLKWYRPDTPYEDLIRIEVCKNLFLKITDKIKELKLTDSKEFVLYILEEYKTGLEGKFSNDKSGVFYNIAEQVFNLIEGSSIDNSVFNKYTERILKTSFIDKHIDYCLENFELTSGNSGKPFLYNYFKTLSDQAKTVDSRIEILEEIKDIMRY